MKRGVYVQVVGLWRLLRMQQPAYIGTNSGLEKKEAFLPWERVNPVFYEEGETIEPILLYNDAVLATARIGYEANRSWVKFWGMAGRSRRAWFSVLLGLVVGFTLASRLILPKATELKKSGQKRKANPAGCGLNGGLRREHGGVLWPPQDNGFSATEKPVPRSNNFLYVGVMTAQKYLNNRAIAAHR